MLEETAYQLRCKFAKVDPRIAKLAETIEAFIHDEGSMGDAERVVAAVLSGPMRAAWMEHRFLKESQAERCRSLLFGGRCGNSCFEYHAGGARPRHDLPWMDHVEVFHTPGKAYVIVSHPYDLDMDRWDEVQRLRDAGCKVYVSAWSWYFYGSTFRVEFWSEAAHEEVELLQRDKERSDG